MKKNCCRVYYKQVIIQNHTFILKIKLKERQNCHKFNKLTAENFAARLKQTDLVNKADFDNNVTSFNN